MDNGTSIWLDVETRDKLKKLADENGRTVAGQIRWMLKELAETEAEEVTTNSDCEE